ncbi:hypothetical protein HNQ60_003579 [Povalibacter uvarum]|uniref:LPXTG cell wall anchor domain-containing protein n=1 Tax=Povalibacter uvarum TaxID=732238 RepID=A0A841HRN7_9GAMM|nr:hypothetical protein [Povalibacter uvarum]MBB6094692.1 hypothetical protein [Povalibacter uvarum]
MRARKFEQGFLALIATAVTALSMSAHAATETSTATPVPLRSAQSDGPAPVRTALPQATAHERAGEIRLASLSPTPAVQAAVAVPQGDPAPQRSTKDLLLLTLVGGMLVAYQLLRKHRLLRQQPFSL